MKTFIRCLIAVIWSAVLASPAVAVDLLERYPTRLTTGDSEGGHARSWKFDRGDIFHVSQFVLKIGDAFKVETGPADLGIGHCADGAVWAVLIPIERGALTSPVTKQEEAIAHVWLRFHPGQIDRLFPPATVSVGGNSNRMIEIREIAKTKMTSSWQANGKAMIPDPKDMTVYIDVKDGSRRFFVVDTQAQKAEYIDAFNPSPMARPLSWASAPPVVVKTMPEAGAVEVLPGDAEIRVTFSKNMQDNSWSWATAWPDSTPEGTEKPHYEADHRTCVLKVKLEPNKAYGYWINSQKFQGFQDTSGHPAVPYLLVFQTKSQP